MNGQRWTLALLAIAVNCWINVPIALSQNLTDQWVEKAARPLVENRVVDGLSVGYIEGKHQGIVHLGSSNRFGKPPDDLTLYEIGSVSKVFTSLMLADLVVRGEIDLNAAADVPNPAGIRLPSRDGRSIKWIDLSTHRSGLPRIPGNLAATSTMDPYRDYDSKKAAAFLKEYALPRRPGDSQEYSNFGASVLGYLVAQKAGKSYQQLLQERIAEPLQMTDCTVDLSEDQRKRLATPHHKFGSATRPWSHSDLPGAGGIHATMRDMLRFAQAQLTPPTGKLGDAIELAWKQQRDADASGPAMGLAWVIAADRQTRWHNGQTGGSHSAIFINRELHCAVVVLCNTALNVAGPNEVDQLAMQLVLKAAGQESKPELGETSDQGSGALAIDAKLRHRLEGRYQVAPGMIFTVRDRDGHLMVDTMGQPAQEVFPDSPTRWSLRGVDATFEFRLGKTGPATSLVFHQSQTASRIEEESKQEPKETSDHGSGAPAIDAKLRHRLEGQYQFAPNLILTVRDRDGHLMVDLTGQPAQEVFPDSPTRWSYRGVDATLEFKLKKMGPATSLVLHQNGIKQTAYRIEQESKEQKQLPDATAQSLKERSPFTAVRWQQSQPEVRVGDEWFKLVSLDGIPVSKIVAFSRRTNGNKWRMRFEEDLVALLTRMGHPPKDTVTLVVRSLTSSERRTLKDVPMTEENRQAIKDAALARQSSQP
jgi:CubicO group peptidase (beta-lactamase class C family)